MPSGISIHCWMRSSCGATKLPRRVARNSPTTVGWRAFQHLDDFAIGAAVRFDARDLDHDAVAMHGVARGRGGNEDVALHALNRTIGDEKAVTVAMHVEAADGEIARFRGRYEMAGAQLDQIAAVLQTLQRQFEVGAGRAFRAELPHELLEIGTGMGQPRNVVEDGGVGHSPIVFHSTLWARGASRCVRIDLCGLPPFGCSPP